jgi:hypothetical protein
MWDSNVNSVHRGSYHRIMDPILYEWLNAQKNKPQFKVSSIYNNRTKNRQRNKKVVSLRFDDLKAARLFALIFDIPEICIRTDEKWWLKVVDKELPKVTAKIQFATDFVLSRYPINHLFILE